MIAPLTREREWLPHLEKAPSWQPPALPTVVLSPHPDDETLGAGGLIQALRARGLPVLVVAVTDGERAYGTSPGLGSLREREQMAALAELGVGPDQISRLRMPDSGLGPFEDRLVDALLLLVSEGTHIVAPWEKDFHPDHEVCGRAAMRVATLRKVPLTSYFFWTWHRGTPETIKDLELRSFALTAEQQAAKARALLCHRSQLEHPDGEPILPEYLRAPAYRGFETFLPVISHLAHHTLAVEEDPAAPEEALSR